MEKTKRVPDRAQIEKNQFARYNHVVVTELEEDETVHGYLEVHEDSLNAYGMIHGGAYYALADVTAGITARCNGHEYVTQSADLHYLGTTKEKKLYGTSRVVKRGHATATVKSEVTDSEGKLLFLAIFTFFCVDGRVEKPKSEEL
jgi:hypothetical protein